ncbi:MAG: hypothetical protein DCC71_14050, partial [Proteobacteria bacterium]
MHADDAAEILLARAVEETRPELAASPDADAAASAQDADGEYAWVLRRASWRLDHDLAAYRSLLALGDAPHAPAWAFAIPLLVGVFSNWLGPAEQIHVLYNPIAVLVAWNLALYAALALGPLVWRRRARRTPEARGAAERPAARGPERS